MAVACTPDEISRSYKSNCNEKIVTGESTRGCVFRCDSRNN